MAAVECDSAESVEILVRAGANVTRASDTGTALHRATTREIALRLLDAGADASELTSEGQRAILGYPATPDEDLLDVSPDEYRSGWSRHFGTGNPERMSIPFWSGMIQSGIGASQARHAFEERYGLQERLAPIWCAQRFGQSMTFLDDGRIVQIGGEHEDGYDPDFCIFNDVIIHDVARNVALYGYPESVFPPTDFHSATVLSGQIFVIGSLGYAEARRIGETPVYGLDINTLQMRPLETSGEKPGWIYGHRATRLSAREIRVTGGTVVTLADGRQVHTRSEGVFVLDVEDRVWRLE
jgi:hypothetical protein